MNIILLGPPGAGKGTQGQILVKDLGLLHISTGEIFRAELKEKTALGEKIKSVMASGGLVSDDIVLEVIEGTLKKRGAENCLFDGFPRTVAQAEGLETLLARLSATIDFVIYVNVSDDEVVRRLAARRACAKCSRIYNTATGPFPKKENTCDACGGTLTKRADDEEKIIKERLGVYRAQTAPLVKHYTGKMRSKFIEINGTGAIEKIYSAIREKMKQG